MQAVQVQVIDRVERRDMKIEDEVVACFLLNLSRRPNAPSSRLVDLVREDLAQCFCPRGLELLQ